MADSYHNHLFLRDIVYIAAGPTYALAVRNDGSIYAWGRNNAGQVGNGGTTDQPYAVKVLTLDGNARVFAGGNTSAAISGSNVLYTWGDNSGGKIGHYATDSYWNSNNYYWIRRSGSAYTPQGTTVQTVSGYNNTTGWVTENITGDRLHI